MYVILRERVYIKSLGDYDKLLNHIDPQYIDMDFIQQLKEHIKLQCELISIEYPYYESDYLSSYYIFYAKKLQTFPKTCYRLLFYKDRRANTLMGFITLRPTYEGSRLGKIFFDPHYLAEGKMSLILGPCKCHVGGSESTINIFPHMKQEGDVAVCAHVATWSVLRSFASRFHKYPELTIGRIVEMVSPESERMIPSRGLTAFQISQVFLDAGFSSVVLFNDLKNPRLIKDALVSYIASGIPVVAVLTSRNHAISVVGLGKRLPEINGSLRELISTECPYESYWESKNEITTNVILSSRFYNSIVVNDDNFFPYAMVHMKRASQGFGDNSAIPYAIPEIDRLIIPLYSRIQLTYEDVRTIFLRLVAADSSQWGEPVICSIFLTSANTYREYLNESCRHMNPDIRKILISLEMPRFIWCVEASTPEHYQLEEPIIDGLVIFDSTSATINPEPFLFVASPKGAVHYKVESLIKEMGNTPNYLHSMPSFSKNLKEVIK